MSYNVFITQYEQGRRKNKKQMTEDKRIPLDVGSVVSAVIRDLDRLESLSPEELAKRGEFCVFISPRQ